MLETGTQRDKYLQELVQTDVLLRHPFERASYLQNRFFCK